MVESGRSVEDWEHFKDLHRRAGEQISQIAQFLREGRGSREEIANLLDEMSSLVGTTLPNMLKISWGQPDNT
jgi:hypothetical protein